jgi:uncharacterized protein (TIGR03435 family)
VRKRIRQTYCAFFVMMWPSMFGQTAPRVGSAFEAASIKPSGPNNLGSGYTLALYPGGRLRGSNLSLQVLIRIAWDLKQKDQVIATLGWLESQKYDLEATTDGAVGEPQARIMLQNLLEERFKLKVHREARDLPVFYLVSARNGKKGPNLREAPSGNCGAMTTPQALPPPSGRGVPANPCGGVAVNPGKISGHRSTIAELATSLSAVLDRPVFDKTLIEGSFDFDLLWEPDRRVPASGPQSQSPEVSGLSIYTALQEQLGLKLESGKGPVETIVVDSAEKAADN